MREIKFRAWNGEKMVNGQLFSISMAGSLYMDTGECGDRYLDYPLMQYTGLKDKNGVEIYEGDVLIYDTDILWEVIYREEIASFSQRSKYGTYDALTLSRFAEVIGNIYQNPELMEQK